MKCILNGGMAQIWSSCWYLFKENHNLTQASLCTANTHEKCVYSTANSKANIDGTENPEIDKEAKL
jgi:hypothetical protein